MTANQQILLVEDNQYDQKLAIRAFEKNGIKNPVFLAKDGEEALDYLFCTGEHAGENKKELPMLVILDLKLPKINGFEVLERIRMDERTALIPVVVLTSSKEQQDIIKAYKHQANAYVQKPVEFKDFSEAIKQVGLFWLVWNQSPPIALSVQEEENPR